MALSLSRLPKQNKPLIIIYHVLQIFQYAKYIAHDMKRKKFISDQEKMIAYFMPALKTPMNGLRRKTILILCNGN